MNDVVNGKPVERGEICFRGPNMTPGYWKMPEKTNQMIDSEGWLHSGDIGMWLPDGNLKIIDRKKNIFKLSQGEDVVIPWLKNQGIAANSLSGACKEYALKQAIQADMRKLAKERGLHGFEQAKAIHLHDELFSLENGLLTPTFKLKRAIAKKEFSEIIEE